MQQIRKAPRTIARILFQVVLQRKRTERKGKTRKKIRKLASSALSKG